MKEIKHFEKLDVQEVLRTIDEKTANEMMRGFSERYGFKVVEINGKVFTTAKELMRVFGYSDERSVRWLLDEYGVETLNIKDLTTEVQLPPLKETLSKVFGIPTRNVHQLKLLDYRAFLVIALNSRTEKAKEVKEYVINMEREARQRITLAQKGLTPETLELAQSDPILAMVETIRQVRLKQLELEQKQRELEERQEKLEKDFKSLSSPKISSSEVLKIMGWVNKVAKLWKEVKSLEGENYTYQEARDYIIAKICKSLRVKDISEIRKEKFPFVIAQLQKNYTKLRKKWKDLKGLSSFFQ